MAPRSQALPASEQESDEDGLAVAPETVLELLNDDHVQAILAVLEAGPRPAREIIEACEASKPTVYRRLNRLEEAGLVDSRMSIHPDGHHRKEFSADFGRLTLDFGEGELTAVVETASNASTGRIGGSD